MFQSNELKVGFLALIAFLILYFGFNFLKGNNCAEIVKSDRNVSFTNSIRKLANNKELREEMGINGYNEIIKNYSKKVVVSKYANLLNSI